MNHPKAVTDLRKPFDQAMFSIAMRIARGAQKSGHPRLYVDTMMTVCREDLSALEFSAVQRFVSNYIEAKILVL